MSEEVPLVKEGNLALVTDLIDRFLEVQVVLLDELLVCHEHVALYFLNLRQNKVCKETNKEML